jgi:hypothetical protein
MVKRVKSERKRTKDDHREIENKVRIYAKGSKIPGRK